MALRAQLRTSCINCRRQCVAVPMQPHHGLSMPLGKSRVAPSFAAPTTECKRPSKASGQAMQAAKQSTTLVQAVVQKEAGLMQASSWEIPTKMKVLIASCLAFTVSNMDKVNISIAIIPMAEEFGWSPGVAGLVQSAFFGGFLLMNVPGGYLSSLIGGRRLLPMGVIVWSAATLAAPLASASIPALCVTRSLVGLGEAVAPTSITDMIARTVPKEERASAVSFAFAGLHVGSIVGMLMAPLIIESVGWPVIFTTFGAAGFVWYVWFEQLMADISIHDPDVARKLVPTPPGSSSSPPGSRRGSSSGSSDGGMPPNIGGRSRASAESLEAMGSSSGSSSTAPGSIAGSGTGGGSSGSSAPAVPYRAFLRSPGVRALCFTHFCNNYFHFTMLAWLPTYFITSMGIDLMHAAQTSLLPPLAGIVCSVASGRFADGLIRTGTPVGTVRKLCQNIAFLGPVTCMLPIMAGWTHGNSAADVALLTAGLGLSAFSLAGLFCTHQDMSSKYAGAMLGLTNTSGAISGLVGVAATGTLFELSHGSWGNALFLPNMVLLVAGALTYTLGARNEAVDFDAADNTPFGFEASLQGPLAAVSAATRPLTSAVSNAWEATHAQTLARLREARVQKLAALKRALHLPAGSRGAGALSAARAAAAVPGPSQAGSSASSNTPTTAPSPSPTALVQEVLREVAGKEGGVSGEPAPMVTQPMVPEAVAAPTTSASHAAGWPGARPVANNDESDGEEEDGVLISPELPVISWHPALAALLGTDDPHPAAAAAAPAAIGKSRVLVAHWGMASICPDDDFDGEITDLEATFEEPNWDLGSEQEMQEPPLEISWDEQPPAAVPSLPTNYTQQSSDQQQGSLGQGSGGRQGLRGQGAGGVLTQGSGGVRGRRSRGPLDDAGPLDEEEEVPR